MHLLPPLGSTRVNFLQKDSFYIKEASVDESNYISWSQEVAQEKKSAVFDLIKSGLFKLKKKQTGPYRVILKVIEWKLILNIYDYWDKNNTDIKISLSSIRRIIRDYQIVCENYVDAIKTAPLKKIEAIDVGRRTIHDEGAENISELLNENIEVDMDTARRIFTLVSIITHKI